MIFVYFPRNRNIYLFCYDKSSNIQKINKSIDTNRNILTRIRNYWRKKMMNLIDRLIFSCRILCVNCHCSFFIKNSSNNNTQKCIQFFIQKLIFAHLFLAHKNDISGKNYQKHKILIDLYLFSIWFFYCPE